MGTKFRVLTLLMSLCLGAAVSTTAAGADVKYGERPNVLFIGIDDLNHWVGYFGRNEQAATPNIDRLAARGVRFTRALLRRSELHAVAHGADVRPAAQHHGCLRQSQRLAARHPPGKMFARAIPRRRVHRDGRGKIYHGNRAPEWDDYLAEARVDPNQPAGRASLPKGADDGVGGIKFAPLDCNDADLPDYDIANYGIEQLGKAHAKPFFLAVGLHKPHMPWNVPKKWFDKFPLDSIKLPPTIEKDLADIPPAGVKMARPEGDHAKMLKSGRWKEAVRAYLAAIAYTDMNVGRVLDALDKSPHKDNTIIVLWGDHGWHLGEKEHWRKFALWEEATRAPFVWVAPGITKPNTVCERTVDFMSIYPTLMDLCSLPTPAHVEGKSIRALLADPASAWDQPALTTFRFNNHAVRSEGWRYIRYADGGEELYDEAADPLEHKNLAEKPEHAERKRQLAKSLPSSNEKDVGNNRRGGRNDE